MIEPESVLTLRMTSGNKATLYLYASACAIAIKREWEREPTREDTDECTAAITKALDSFGVPVGKVIHKNVDDLATADQLVAKHMRENLQ